ncbi:hypothetical protein RJ640_027548 [Escallonia rubra]|uniref:PIN-like protein n=1 Tax=Escallonia rubra TaxID=112253 RepID=A0AA88QKS6_9ASTE|nr:hypothetical protein RJ640_027548 [Escallonia rubra]
MAVTRPPSLLRTTAIRFETTSSSNGAPPPPNQNPLALPILSVRKSSWIVRTEARFLVAKICRPPPEFTRFTVIVTAFGNTGNLPLAIVGSICHSAENPLGPECHRTGVAYVSFAQWVAVLLVYTLVYHMMEPPLEYYEVVEENGGNPEIEEQLQVTNLSKPLIVEAEWPGMEEKETENCKPPFIARIFTSSLKRSASVEPDTGVSGHFLNPGSPSGFDISDSSLPGLPPSSHVFKSVPRPGVIAFLVQQIEPAPSSSTTLSLPGSGSETSEILDQLLAPILFSSLPSSVQPAFFSGHFLLSSYKRGTVAKVLVSKHGSRLGVRISGELRKTDSRGLVA